MNSLVILFTLKLFCIDFPFKNLVPNKFYGKFWINVGKVIEVIEALPGRCLRRELKW